MNQERLMKVLLAPHVTEKTSVLAEKGQFVFKVVKDAKKLEIKKAVESMFDVEVTHVRTLNVKGKSKRVGAIMGRRKDWKKAYVSLKDGQDIDFSSAE